MELKQIYIFNHLDTPPRFLIWPVKQSFAVIVPFFLISILISFFWGLILSASIAYSMRLLKKHFGDGAFRGISFWIISTSKEQYPVSPPSYIREFIG